jgi:hypothetical protein
MVLFVVLLTITESLAQCNVPLYTVGKTMEVLMVQLNEYQFWYCLYSVFKLQYTVYKYNSRQHCTQYFVHIQMYANSKHT